MLLAHGRFKYIKMFGDLSFHCILDKTTPMSKTGKIKMASEEVSRQMVLEIKYVNANNAVIHNENSNLLLDLKCSPKKFGNWDFGKN